MIIPPMKEFLRHPTVSDNGGNVDVSGQQSLAPECPRHGGKNPKTSSWGGPRPGFGGAQPGSGRPRKPVERPAYAPDTLRWCVFAVWGEAQISAAQELTRQGYETYTPMMAIRRRDPVIPTKFNLARVAMIPGYGFIRLTASQPREPIMLTRGVRTVLCRADGKPQSVPDLVIEHLRAGDESRLQLPAEHGPPLRHGAKVKIAVGAFQGHSGVVLNCDGVRTQVEIDLFGRHIPLWVDRSAVAEA